MDGMKGKSDVKCSQNTVINKAEHAININYETGKLGLL